VTDEKDSKETSEDVTEGVTPKDSSADESAAGPVAEDGTSSSQAAGDVPPSTPPADDASVEEEAQGEAPSEESVEAPVAEQEEAEAGETAEEAEAEEAKPAEKPEAEKKDKKDVIPGADLEPIAVEQEEAPLSAEERARLEAEEEERARREAELAGEVEEEPRAASRAPAKLESGARFLATGKRKRSIARVIVLPGSGKIEINKRSVEEFFPRPLHQTMARQPLTITGYENNVDVRVRVHGGGISGQAGAVRHGIARALTEVDPELRGELKRRGFLTRDARVKERRKAGLKKARKRPQFSKR
jgi:small subunit ribosomal protein S9